MFSLDALPSALKCVEMFIEAGSVDAVLKVEVSESEIKKPKRPKKLDYWQNRIFSESEDSRNSKLFYDRFPKVVDSSPVKLCRSTHTEWALFTMKNPVASGLMHILTSKMDKSFTVTASYKCLAEILGCCEKSILNAVATLVKSSWIDVIRSGKGTISTFVVRQGVRK